MAALIPALHPATIAPAGRLTDYLDVARDAGFKAADFAMPAALELATTSGPEGVAAAFASRGLAAGGWGAGVRLTGPDSDAVAALAKLPRMAEIAAAARASAALLVVPNRTELTPADAWRQFAERTVQVADVLANWGLTVGLEFIGPNLWPALPHLLFNDIRGTLELADRTGRANVGVLFDTYHFHCGASRIEDIRAATGRITHVHLNDAPPGDPRTFDDSMRRLPGEGVIDLARVVRELEAVGYRGPAGVEIFNPELKALSAAQGAARVAAACRTAFGAL
ncbi:MAG: sugar phosphate isomerase/epimerase [Actinobacteria bacterium]|nr:sugar phosphate isomerase/epimerase [Actinomycetota bacterium]